MSAGYATKLSYREDLGGQLGDKELHEKSGELEAKLEELTQLIAASRNIIAFTGAGISTAAGVPDFRGPNGIWTLQRAGKPIPEFKVTFATAKPTLTHQALLALMQAGKLRYICSQNVDGLHLRSGVPRAQLAELHGNCFAERCPRCGTEYIRDWEMETVGFKATGRRCTAEGCRGRLRDHVLDWEDALPEDELCMSERMASQADLAICLGTSLQITPACNLPLRTVKAGGKLVICNLQRTPKDSKAHLVIRARVDDVMRHVAAGLGMSVPCYVRSDAVLVAWQQAAARRGSASFTLRVASSHGDGCPLPLIKGVDVNFLDRDDLEPASMRCEPFKVTRTVSVPAEVTASITLQLDSSLDAAVQQTSITFSLQKSAHSFQQIFTFVSQTQSYLPAICNSATASMQALEPADTLGRPCGDQSSKCAIEALKPALHSL